jgi:hypothetical protein
MPLRVQLEFLFIRSRSEWEVFFVNHPNRHRSSEVSDDLQRVSRGYEYRARIDWRLTILALAWASFPPAVGL